MKLEASRLALETIATLRPLLPRIRRHDRSLAVQLVRAASSLALNLGEGEYSDPGTRRARYCTAAGSANETRAALAVAVAWGYLSATQAEPTSHRLDRVIAMLWRLTHN
jgi:four helix bundle protein